MNRWFALVDAPTAAHYTGRPPSTLRRWTREGRLTRYGTPRHALYDIDELPEKSENRIPQRKRADAMSPKREDPEETARWRAAMERTDRRTVTLPAFDRAPTPPDALTVHAPPLPTTRCGDCPAHGCRACQHLPPTEPWVTMTHSVTGHTQRVPNNPDAIEGQRAVGWYLHDSHELVDTTKLNSPAPTYATRSPAPPDPGVRRKY